MLSSIRLRRSSRALVLAGLAALMVVVPSGAQAAKPGNSQNAKACQKGGWRDLVRSDGRAFANQGNCVSYAAKGGQLQPKSLTPLQQCQRELAAAGLTAPPNANYILGTPGNDAMTASQMTPGVDIVCGFGGDDSLANLAEGDIFLGGDGNDVVRSMAGGTFNGGAGDDRADVSGGTFNGGAGNDWAMSLDDGTFNGGEGDDVATYSLGTFNGGDGNDHVGSLYAGTFNGEAGCDSVGEDGGGTFNPGDQSTCSV